MTKGSDNPFGSVLVVEGSAPASPASGDQRLFLDVADHKLKRVDSVGTVVTVEAGGAAVYPKRATLWADEMIMPGGATVAVNVDAAQRYAFYMNPSSAANGDTFTLSFMARAGTYTMYVLGCTSGNLGIIDWSLDTVSQSAGDDWYSASLTKNIAHSFSITVVGDGYHVLKGTINGKNGASAGYYWLLTKLWMVPAAD